MSPEQYEAFRLAFARWFRGDGAAVALCLDLLAVAHTWDDLIDGDVAISPEAVTAAFRRMLIDIPANPFHRHHAPQLVPVLASVLLQWQAANVLEREQGPDDLPKAYMLRAGIYQVFAFVAWLIGGDAWAAQVSPEVWRLYGETLSGFEEEMRHA